jgi:hypothetical protein
MSTWRELHIEMIGVLNGGGVESIEADMDG